MRYGSEEHSKYGSEKRLKYTPTKHRKYLALLCFLALTVAVSTQAPATSGLDAALAELDARLAGEFAKDGVGGVSVGVVSGGKLIWSKHYGYADAEAKRIATNETAYRIGSITKQFTVLALMQLAEQGKLRLADPLEKYVPEIRAVQGAPPGAAPITLLQVGTMMSGLAREPDCANHSVGPLSGWQKKVLDCLPQTRYQFEPGTQYLYSNIGYAALGVAIERAGVKPYVDQVAERIFVPLGMTRSTFEPTAEIRKNLAHGYQRRNDTVSRSGPDAELEGRGYRVPNGAIFSTITDLSKFVAWELGAGPAGLLKQTTQDENYRRVYSSTNNGDLAMSSGYGLGFQAARRGDVVMLGHGGSTAGYHASALFHRGTKLGVIVLRNCDSCAVDATPVATYMLERVVTAMRPAR